MEPTNGLGLEKSNEVLYLCYEFFIPEVLLILISHFLRANISIHSKYFRTVIDSSALEHS